MARVSTEETKKQQQKTASLIHKTDYMLVKGTNIIKNQKTPVKVKTNRWYRQWG
jgi:hypothetical protein